MCEWWRLTGCKMTKTTTSTTPNHMAFACVCVCENANKTKRYQLIIFSSRSAIIVCRLKITRHTNSFDTLSFVWHTEHTATHGRYHQFLLYILIDKNININKWLNFIRKPTTQQQQSSIKECTTLAMTTTTIIANDNSKKKKQQHTIRTIAKCLTCVYLPVKCAPAQRTD